tara:strand:+ start:26 stop:694 length:669 start_codon:yes stop_codon:yes gene_type:complete
MENRVISSNPVLDLYTKLDDILYSTRAKRDGVALLHEHLKIENDNYNKIVIVLSLFTAFVETLKSNLDLTDKAIHGTTVAHASGIAPIFLTTIIGIISSLMKFKKFPETMEVLLKSREKFNSLILKIRKLSEELNFKKIDDAKRIYIDEIMDAYRLALLEVESNVYPDVRNKYFKLAQRNIIQIEKDDQKFKDKINKLFNNDNIIEIGSNSTVEELETINSP